VLPFGKLNIAFASKKILKKKKKANILQGKVWYSFN
jgi:hypothetical protein